MSTQQKLPKSRITLTYRTTIDGEPKVVNLPFRLLLLGDFSKGTSKERREHKEIDQRRVWKLGESSVAGVMSAMDITLKVSAVDDYTQPVDATTKVRSKCEVLIPLKEGTGSFSPDSLAREVKQIRYLVLLKTHLRKMQSEIDSPNEAKDLNSAIYSDSGKLSQIQSGIKSAVPGNVEKLMRPVEHASTIAAPPGSTPKVLESVMDDPTLVPTREHWQSILAALSFFNVEAVEDEGSTAAAPKSRYDRGQVGKAIKAIDEAINNQVNAILHAPEFQEMEALWRGVDELVSHTNFDAGIAVDLLDVSKDELKEDFRNHASYPINGGFFKKVYVEEYDQYGGKPFGGFIGLYDFANTTQDITWLGHMATVANACHAPFISSVNPKFFGFNTVKELESVKDFSSLLSQPKFGRWNEFRDTEEAAYVGLTFPRYVLRLPWDPMKNPCEDLAGFTEEAAGDDSKYLWGNAAILMARNMVRSFETAGWCQYLRGPKGGGLIAGLPVHAYPLDPDREPKLPPIEDQIKPPVELVIPDYHELQFANGGIIPLIYKKGSSEATFFSTQSAKRAKRFRDPKDSENAQLVTNLCYTFSITRIAHYVRCIVRDNIGSTADHLYIQNVLDAWLSNYVTKVSNPDDLTVRRYPFKAKEISVVPRAGDIGRYDCTLSVLPHIQFEGMNVELRLESRFG